jgi:chemotaxis protein MotB
MAKGKCPECEAGAPAWVVTFGDLMSLLMTFFVLLLSFATMEKPREFEEAMVSIKGAFGVMPENLTSVQISPMAIRAKRLPKKAEEAARDLQREIQVQGKQDEVRVDYDKSGALKISLPNRVLYDSGQAELRPDAYPFLTGVAEILSGFSDAFFEVHGYTDNTGMSNTTLFRDNMDLSYARADSVMRFISSSSGMNIDRFQAVGHGAGQPIATNTTPEGRLANRRVEIYVRGLLTETEVRELKDEVSVLAEN